MLAVSQAELQLIQQELVSAVCDQTCSIYRKTAPTPDGYGSSVPNYTHLSDTVCGVGQPNATHLQNFDYMIGAEASYLVHVPVGTNLLAQDHIVTEAQTLEVHVLLTPESYQGLLSVLCAQIK